MTRQLFNDSISVVPGAGRGVFGAARSGELPPGMLGLAPPVTPSDRQTNLSTFEQGAGGDSGSHASQPTSGGAPLKPMAWGKGRSDAFKRRVVEICKDIGIEPDWLMTCMAFETMESFRPDIRPRRKDGSLISSAVGLIQFVQETARGLGTTVEKLAGMTDVEQLEYVHKHFLKHRGKLRSLEDTYLAILYPIAIGKGEHDAVFDAHTSKEYLANSPLDTNKDGVVEKSEIAARIRLTMYKGLRKEHYG